MDTAYWLQQLSNGLAAGSIYALIAVGYSMVYSVLYLINFAHGDLYMFGTFIALTIIESGAPVWAAIAFACLAGALLGMVTERFAYRPVRHANRIVPMVSALGAALVLRSLAQALWGASTKPFPSFLPTGRITIGSASIGWDSIVILVVSVVLVALMSLMLSRTKVGNATKAVCADIEAASYMGIDVNRVIVGIYAIAGVLGVVGGVMFSAYYNATYIGMGLLGTMKAWAAVMIAGVGNIYGALVGGLILGVVEAFAGAVLGSGYKNGVALVLIVLILVLKPAGLFGTRMTKRA
ncbi:MAG TPA: branched-chain amino acid ABC transporter permease [Cellulomonas sp.]